MKFYRGNSEIYDIRPEDDSTRRVVHMGENVLNLTFRTVRPLDLRIGDYVLFDNEKYKLKKLVNPTRKSEFELEYSLQLMSPQYDLQDALYILSDSTKVGELDDTVPLFGTLTFHLQQIVKCAKEVYSEWRIGVVTETGEGKNITYSEMDCLRALQHLAEEFNTEYWITNNAIHMGKRKEGAPLLFKYGKGNALYDLTRQNLDGRIVTKLLVRGSDRNIDSATYKSKYLHLPNNQKYVYKNTDKYGIVMGRKYFPEIYPRLIHKTSSDPGAVTSVRVDDKGIYWIKDAYLNFTPEVLPDKSLKVVFQSGQLGGLEIDANWHDDKKEYELIRGDYGLGQEMPGGTFVPKAGDLYLLSDLKMPAAYIAAAERELQAKALEAIAEMCEQKVSYKGTVNPLYFKELGDRIEAGRAVTVEDADVVDGGRTELRVQAFTRGINDEYNIDIEISDTIYVSRLDKIETDIRDDRVETEQNFREGSAITRRLWRDLMETNDMLYDPEGILTERIKALSVQVAQVIVGMNSSQFDFVGVKFQPNYGGNYNDFRWTGGQLVHYTVVENQATYWNIPAGTMYMTDNSPYYVYARCFKTGTSGGIRISKTPILLEAEEGTWHFWIGVLNSPYTIAIAGGTTNTARSWQPMHGYTEICGDNITTGIIKSADGKTWFNLKTGEISGRIKFLSNNEYNDLSSVINALNEATSEINEFLGDVKDESDNLEDFLNGAFSDNIVDEAEAKSIEKYLNTLNESMAKLESTYNKLFVNAYLEGTPKTDLLNAKINLFGKRDTLVQGINTAVAVLSSASSTPTQKNTAKNNVNTAFNDFNTAVATFQNAVEEANKAIQKKLEALADAKIRSLAFGGVNLLKNSDRFGQGWADPGISLEIVKENGADVLKVNASNPNASNGVVGGFLVDPALDTTALRDGDDIVVSYWARAGNDKKPWIRISTENTFPSSAIEGRMNGQYSQFYAVGKYKPSALSIYIGFRDMPGTYWFSKFKVEKGNKPTDWSPAPSELAKAAIVKDMEYLKKALENDTIIDGGLILSTYIKLGMKNGSNWIEKAGIAGSATAQTDPIAWFGGTMADASVLFKVDGSGRLARGNINWDTAGNINMQNATMKDIKATNAEITGKVESSKSGNRIIVDPDRKSIRFVESNGKEVMELTFSDSANFARGNITLCSYEGSSLAGSMSISGGGINIFEGGEKNNPTFSFGLRSGVGGYGPLFPSIIMKKKPPTPFLPGEFYIDGSNYVKWNPA